MKQRFTSLLVGKFSRLLALALALALALFASSVHANSVHAQIATPESWVALPQINDPLLNNLAIPANAAIKGMWSGVHDWPLNGLHAALLPDGRVLTFGSTPDGIFQSGRYFDVWDPTRGFVDRAHNTVYDPTRQDSFCATAVFLSDG
jgi:hypothetical protein